MVHIGVDDCVHIGLLDGLHISFRELCRAGIDLVAVIASIAFSGFLILT